MGSVRTKAAIADPKSAPSDSNTADSTGVMPAPAKPAAIKMTTVLPCMMVPSKVPLATKETIEDDWRMALRIGSLHKRSMPTRMKRTAKSSSMAPPNR